MYGYIKGTIKDIESNYVVIDNHDIGYIIYVPNPYYYKLEEVYTIYTHTQVREDEYSLYGFPNQDELKLFLKLIQVKGVGLKEIGADEVICGGQGKNPSIGRFIEALWTGCFAVTWASARPKWLPVPSSNVWPTVSRRRFWCRPPFWQTSIITP